MTYFVQPTCREIGEHYSSDVSESPPRPLEEFRDTEAYVLLGPPGSGKTTAFTGEAKCQGGHYVPARDFQTFDDRPEWHNTTLYVDGLDETRAGSLDGRTPFDSIRAKLHGLGCPRFRLSCREADWFGTSDRDHLKTASPNGEVVVLRLDSLSPEGVREILHENLDIEDPEGFVSAARERGLESLLTNPQSLRMLALAIGGDEGWPDTKTQAFEKACRTLVKEHNLEHQMANRDRVVIPDLMDACGRLCAVQLLSGAAGFTLPGKEGDNHFPGLDQIRERDQEKLLHCLQSKLFETPAFCRASPVHRQIAEFLSARHLAGLMEKGLPVGRVLALISGHDGVVVSELRGLSAWLAAHSKRSRAEVIARDPLGTVLYGDAGNFSPDEKRWVLDGLKREAEKNPWFLRAVQLDSRLGVLVSPDMENALREILSDPSREDSGQSFTHILIETLIHGEPLPGLAGPLMKLIKDETRWPGIRRRGVDAFVRQGGNDEKAFEELKHLANDVYAGRITDPGDDLLGCLLTKLYPRALPETEVMKYLRSSKRPNYGSTYEHFWRGYLPNNSTPEQLAQLLDEFVAQYNRLLSEAQRAGRPLFFLRRLPLALLSRVLVFSREEINLNRLFDWLGVAAWVGDWRHDAGTGAEEKKRIQNWLVNHPEMQKSLMSMGLKRCMDLPECADPPKFRNCIVMEWKRFFDIRPPDFGLWCLEQAAAAEDQNAAGWLVHQVAECLHHRHHDVGLSRRAVSGRLADNTKLRKIFDDTMAGFEGLSANQKVHDTEAQRNERNEQRKWRDFLKPHEDELRENKAKSELLHNLSKAYFDVYIDLRGDTPRDRLNNLLGNDESLVEAVLCGFRGSVDRTDLPTDSEIIRLGARNQTHRLALPFMAGMEEIAKTAPTDDIGVDSRQLRLGLAIHYTLPMWPLDRHHADRSPSWFPSLLSRCPRTVADVLVKSAHSKLRKGAESPAGLYELAHSEDYSVVARSASLPLLDQFPVRCTSGQLSTLNHLLLAARRHCGIEPLLDRIDQKLSHRSMNVAQRAYWLTAGLCVAPESYRKKLEAYADGSERRIRFVAEAVGGQFDFSRTPNRQHDVATLKLLIRLMGSSFKPYSRDSDSDKGEPLTQEMNAASCVQNFIDQVASVPSLSATAALNELLHDGNLLPWHTFLIDALYRQNALRREAGFQYCNVDQVLETLDKRKPANAADLTALTFEYLREISSNIRDGNTSDWRQYWNEDSYNQPESPKPEDACRNTLLSTLRIRLTQLGIDAQPEGRYADGKRADIRVSLDRYNVPVEIKKDCHRDLWSAIKTQLIAKYTRDPQAEGCGIYLVFWFGDTEDHRLTPPASGPLPRTAVELEDRLRSTLSAEEIRKIRICVVDVSNPT